MYAYLRKQRVLNKNLNKTKISNKIKGNEKSYRFKYSVDSGYAVLVGVCRSASTLLEDLTVRKMDIKRREGTV